MKTEIGYIATLPFLAVGRDRPSSEGAISAAKTVPRLLHAPAPPGRSRALPSDLISGPTPILEALSLPDQSQRSLHVPAHQRLG